MVRWTGSNTGCPNHVNWPINPNPSAVSSALRVGRREKEKEGREREKKRDGYSLLCFCVPFLSEPYATRNDGRAWCSSDLDRQTQTSSCLFGTIMCRFRPTHPASDRVLSVPNKHPTLGAAKDLRFLCHMRLLLRTGGGLWGRH